MTKTKRELIRDCKNGQEELFRLVVRLYGSRSGRKVLQKQGKLPRGEKGV